MVEAFLQDKDIVYDLTWRIKSLQIYKAIISEAAGLYNLTGVQNDKHMTPAESHDGLI